MYSEQIIYPSDSSTTANDSNKQPSIVDDFMYGSNVANSHVSIRLGFIRKVYGILSVQLLFTIAVSTIIMMFPSVTGFVKENSWLLIVNFLATFFIIIALMIKRTEYPANYYLLAAFTFFESITIGIIISLYDKWLVIEAFALTAIVVMSLTLFTYQTKRDFKFGGALLFSLLSLLIFGGLFQLFFQSQILDTGLAVLGAFIFSGFIIYDTQMIMKHLHAEEYIVGVINLYLDIINLFLEILKILDSLKNK